MASSRFRDGAIFMWGVGFGLFILNAVSDYVDMIISISEPIWFYENNDNDAQGLTT